MIDYRYVLIRYVPDPERMEPINVGIILQGNGRLDLRISPHAAKRKEVNTGVFGEWRSFFKEEIHGDAAPLFQPDRSTSRFLTHLNALCDGPVALSRPLMVSVDSSRSFEELLASLYDRLVAPPESVSPSVSMRPTGRFRQLSEQHRFVERGMLRYSHVMVDAKSLWTAYRQVVNGEVLAFDKVEVANFIGYTSNEIERLPRVAERLETFLTAPASTKPRRYALLADQFVQPFPDQTDGEFKAMRDDLEQAVELITKRGGTVLRSREDVERFADEIDAKLPRAAS